MAMKLPDIANARLVSQQIASSKFTKTKDLVAYMGAIQSQDYAMSKWAIGLRCPGSTEKQIELSLDKGEILRTHVLRPTWHIVAAEDIYWMLALSKNKIRALMKTMDKQLELTEKIFTKSNKAIEKCFAENMHVDRDKIAACLEKSKIKLEKNRLSHLLIRAELDEIICSGKTIAGKRTYALLAERVPKKKLLSKDESLALLAKKYFSSRGPATIEDFSWWAGVNLTDARHGLEQVKTYFQTEKINGADYWFSKDLQVPVKSKSSVYLLPAYDEFIISYKNRTASLALEHQKKALTQNGIFHPVVVVNGRATGLWKRSLQKEKLHVETEFFHPHDKNETRLVEQQKKVFRKFLGVKEIVS